MKNLTSFSFSLIIMSCISFTSCSDNLTREKAEKLILTKYNLPKQVTEELGYGNLNYSAYPNLSLEDYLVKHNLITFEFIGNSRDMFFEYRQYKLELTAEGKKYLLSTTSNRAGEPIYLVKVTEKVFGEITGIREIENQKIAEVDFTLKYENTTPFGEAYSLKAEALERSRTAYLPYYKNGEVFKETITMVKYDDGWRIE
jgi:hypothetical protein